MAEEDQSVEGEREHEIPPKEFKKIELFLDENPNRYVDPRHFVNEAIKFFLDWETDPPAAHKSMAKDFTPLLKQMAYAKAQHMDQIMNDTYPGLLDKHKDEIEKFLDKNPSYRIPLYDSAPSPDPQAEARASTDDLIKLRERKNSVRKFIEKIDFNKIQPKDNQKEIFYDEWPLISTYYSRILPAKISIIAIADLMYKNKSEMIRLDENNIAKIYDIAEELSTELKTIEEKEEIKRVAKYSTGLPKQFPKDKMNASQALSEKRWKDRFIGKRRKQKDTDKNFFDGLLSTLGLVRAFSTEDKKKVFLTLSAKGKKFYSMDNHVINTSLEHLDSEDYHEIGSFTPEERKFLVTKILPERKLEMELIKTAIQRVDKLTNGTGAIVESLDAEFMNTIKTFAESEKDVNVQMKIREEIIGNTIKVQEENKNKSKKEEVLTPKVLTPIQSHRVATMGRLAEMGLVEWIIDEKSKSTYKINEEAREQVDVILNTK